MLESQQENLVSMFLVQNVGSGEGQVQEPVIQCLPIDYNLHVAQRMAPSENGSALMGLRVLQWAAQQPVHLTLHRGRSSFLQDSWAHPGSPS